MTLHQPQAVRVSGQGADGGRGRGQPAGGQSVKRKVHVLSSGDDFSFPSAADGAATAAFTGGCRRLKRTARCWDEELRAEGRAQVFGN